MANHYKCHSRVLADLQSASKEEGISNPQSEGRWIANPAKPTKKHKTCAAILIRCRRYQVKQLKGTIFSKKSTLPLTISKKDLLLQRDFN